MDKFSSSDRTIAGTGQSESTSYSYIISQKGMTFSQLRKPVGAVEWFWRGRVYRL